MDAILKKTSPLIPALFLMAQTASGQAAKPAQHGSGQGISAERAIALAEGGHCKEALATLKRTLEGNGAKEIRKHAGIVGLHCAMAVDNRETAEEFLRVLGRDFAKDPDALYVIVHAYSDLSSRTAEDLGQLAPDSVPARELNAEALEVQGKWNEALGEYRQMLKEHPQLEGIHYRIGRILLSKPDPTPRELQQAKEEMQEELKIDPNNAGAEYVIGEMEVQAQKCPEAIEHFSRAAKLDASFGDAFLGWGFCLVTTKQYEAAISPLKTAVRLQPGNPAAHYNLAMALSRTGRKEEAGKEFAIHRDLVKQSDANRVKNE